MTQQKAAAGTSRPESPPVILDCTIRDGSYAIDFKFTAADTALVAALLDEAGTQYIEIGHGLGLGASEAGKGVAPSRDLEVIELTRERVGRGRIGAFFIPGIGGEEDLRGAADAGLDFVRVGQNADEMETAWPFVELARELGLEVFVNLMKTYGISPSSAAEHARRAAELGARGMYVVDSAGGMMPDEVRSYVDAAREAAALDLGFHGHSNMHLAVANSLAALEAGARFVDTSVYGIGRSSGNVPTEVMVAVLDRLGIDCGIDALRIIDIAESYLRPLAEHLHPHDMIAVSLGYGRFHSSYLPRALSTAQQEGVNPFRLIVELGRRDMMRLPDELLSDVVGELKDAGPPPEVRSDLAAFSDAGFQARRISNRPQAVADLVDGLEVVAAKRHLAVVLDLVLSRALDDRELTAEFVIEDDSMALGRVRFGSLEAVAEVLGELEGRIELALLDCDALDEPDVHPALLRLGAALPHRLIPYSPTELELAYLGDAALATIASEPLSEVALCDPEWYPSAEVERLASRIAAAARLQRFGAELPDQRPELVVLAGPHHLLRSAVDDATKVLSIDSDSRQARRDGPAQLGALVRDDAYRNTFHRWAAATSAAKRVASDSRVAS